MQRFKSSVSLLVAFVMTFSVICLPSKVYAAELVNITVLATSDIHGKIYPWEYATDSSQEYGLAKLATIIKEVREEDPNILLVDNGDAIESNMIHLFNDDEVHPMIAAFNLLEYDTFTLGNHEFNFGLDVLNKAIENFNGDTLSANIEKSDGEDWVLPYVIKEVKGVKIGILGLTTPHIPRWEASTPEHFEGLDFLDPLTTAQKYVDILKNEEKVDVVLGVFHIGKGSEGYNPNMVDSVKEIAEQVKGIDAIVAGHAHDTLGKKDNQLIYGDTIVLEPSSNGEYIGRIDLTLEKDGSGYKVIEKSTDLLSPVGVEPDTEILEALEYVDIRSKEVAYTVIGEATEDFLPEDDVKGIPIAQVKDNAIISLINEVQLFYTGADVSAAALFDTRSNLKEGELQFKDVALIYKYSNTLQAHEITGENLKKYMEWSASYYNTQVPGDVTISFNPDIRAYNYDMFANIDYKIDLTRKAGNRIVNPTINGEPIDDKAIYVLAINNYRVGTLQSLGLLPEDGNESIKYDSTFTDTPEMQRLIQKYVVEELNGVLEPKINNNWEVLTRDSSYLEGTNEAIELINKGIITLPKSEDGRTPNVKSVNVLKRVTDEDIAEIAEAAKIDVSLLDKSSIEFSGNLYKQVYDLLNSDDQIDTYELELMNESLAS